MQQKYVIELEDAGRRFDAGGELLLDAALAHGVAVPFSCRRGECGCCKVRVLEGRHEAETYGGLGKPYGLADDEMLLCRSRACSDMRIEIPGWSFDAPALRFEAAVLEKTPLAADIVRLVLQPQAPATPEVRAGQYMKFYLDDGSSRCFSVANLPAADDGRLEFHIRRVAGGKFSQQMLDALRPGDRLSLEGGFGACTWQDGDHAELVFFATGTGYAGIKPILLAALAQRDTRLSLYWGGNDAGDFYDSTFLDALAAADKRFRWRGVTAACGLVQQAADEQAHDWRRARVYTCGNPAMLDVVRACCAQWGVARHDFIAEAFVPSGASSAPLARASFDPVFERVGPRYSLDGMLAAREKSIRAVAQIAGKLRIGMSTAQALEMADLHLREMGASHTWHPTYIRFGDDTVRTPRQGVQSSRTLQASDIVVVDIGPVWDGYEGDFGDTFVFGLERMHLACAQAARDVFSAAKEAWKTGLTGRALYDHAEAEALRGGWMLERNLAGHRVSDFPHALFGPAKLAEMDIVPADAVWVLEIQLRHPVYPVGAFYEDILIGLPG